MKFRRNQYFLFFNDILSYFVIFLLIASDVCLIFKEGFQVIIYKGFPIIKVNKGINEPKQFSADEVKLCQTKTETTAGVNIQVQTKIEFGEIGRKLKVNLHEPPPKY